MSGTPFIKMHGLGNDFVVIDARAKALRLSAEDVRAIANRHTGIGCDQLIEIETPHAKEADAFMRIWNADGGEVAACGNASRCVASLLMGETKRASIVLETRAGLLAAEAREQGRIAVDMGVPRLGWQEIPLARAMDTLHLDLVRGPLRDAVGVSMGNPHAVFFVADVEAVDLATLGPTLERDPLFPERANIGIAQMLDRTRIRLRVWERGVGLTLACGTGACAALVAAVRRGLAERRATLMLDGGPLEIEWRADDHVMMAGPVATSFTGVFPNGAAS